MPAPVLQIKRGAAANIGIASLRAGEPGFTTDKHDFYIGLDATALNQKFFGSARYWKREDTTNAAQLKLVDKDGTNYVAIKAPDTLAGIVTYRLPGTQGGASSVLTNDGSGNLTWASGSANPVFSGIATFTDTTDNTLGNPDTGAVQIDGGLGVNKNVTIGAGLSVIGQSYFIGTASFYGGTINLGDGDTDDVVFGGEIKSSLIPTDDATYNLGTGAKRWNNASFAGVGTFATGAVVDAVRIGITSAGTIDTTAGNLVLHSATGTVEVSNILNVIGDLDVSGNVFIGGTTVTLRGTDVFIENKDIVLGYTTSVTPNDTTANHAGVAIASTEGSPLVSFSASGINTLPDTYKQMMWFKSGTLGFATDAFGFNYGVAIGTTTMANGVRLAVGSGITMSDNSISAANGYFTNLSASNISGSLTGTISTATRAVSVDVVGVATNQNYYITLVDGSGNAKSVGVDAELLYNPNTNTLTVGTGVGITQFSGSVSTGTSTSSVPTSSAVIDYVGTQIGNVDLTLGLNADTGGPSTVNTSQTLTINGTASEVETSVSGQTVTVGLPDAVVVGTSLSSPTLRTGTIQSSNTGATVFTLVADDASVAGDFTVGGNLFVNGSTTQVNTTTLNVKDTLVDLGLIDTGGGVLGVPTSDLNKDIGLLLSYYTDSAKKAAMFWDDSAGRIVFADEVTESTGVLTVASNAYASIEIEGLWVNDCAGQSQVITCTGAERFLQNITVDAGTF